MKNEDEDEAVIDIGGRQAKIKQQVQKHLQSKQNIKDLGLSQDQKQKLMKKIKEDEIIKQRKMSEAPMKKTKVGQNVGDIVGVMSKLHLNNGLYRQKDVEENLADLR